MKRWVGKVMKRGVMALAALAVLACAGCGGEVTFVASTGTGTIVVTTVSPPSISLAQFRQDTTSRTVFGSIDFFAPDSGIASMTTTVTDSSGSLVLRIFDGLPDYNGQIQGSIPFSINYAAFPPDVYTLSIFVTNRAGYMSNPVFATFRTF